MMKVTIRDIAEAVGLSQTTVSLVLNNRPSRISEETKEKVRQTARSMGYYPNAAAVGLRTNRSHSIGLIVPDIRNDYYANYARGMEDACQKLGWSLILCTTSNNPQQEENYIRTLDSRGIDGISIATTPSPAPDQNKKNAELILQLGIPLVQMDLTNYQKPANAVISNHFNGGYIATYHLLSLGHRDIIFIAGPAYLEGSHSRILGCQKAFQDFHIEWRDDMVYHGNYSYQAGMDGIDAMISRKFSAVFAFNDMMAYGVYHSLSKYNLKVPDDISVIGYDDNYVSKIVTPPLTTIHQPIYEMGMEASRILIGISEKEIVPPVIHKFDLTLIMRESTRALKKT